MVFLPGMVALTGQASGRDPQTTEQGVRYAHQPARRSQVLGLDTHALLLLPLSETLGAQVPARLKVFCAPVHAIPGVNGWAYHGWSR